MAAAAGGSPKRCAACASRWSPSNGLQLRAGDRQAPPGPHPRFEHVPQALALEATHHLRDRPRCPPAGRRPPVPVRRSSPERSARPTRCRHPPRRSNLHSPSPIAGFLPLLRRRLRSRLSPPCSAYPPLLSDRSSRRGHSSLDRVGLGHVLAVLSCRTSGRPRSDKPFLSRFHPRPCPAPARRRRSRRARPQTAAPNLPPRRSGLGGCRCRSARRGVGGGEAGPVVGIRRELGDHARRNAGPRDILDHAVGTRGDDLPGRRRPDAGQRLDLRRRCWIGLGFRRRLAQRHRLPRPAAVFGSAAPRIGGEAAPAGAPAGRQLGPARPRSPRA